MNCRILVVDDDRTVRSAIAEFLNDEGFQTDTSENAKAAVTKMKTVKYDIVVMEVSLPRYSGGYSGRYLLNHIHNRYPTVKTIVVTGDATIETGLESFRLGASCWIRKPFSLVTLRDRISDIIRLKNVLSLPKKRCRNRLNC
jgi:DNA-binding NtrC family response regulator